MIKDIVITNPLNEYVLYKAFHERMSENINEVLNKTSRKHGTGGYWKIGTGGYGEIRIELGCDFGGMSPNHREEIYYSFGLEKHCENAEYLHKHIISAINKLMPKILKEAQELSKENLEEIRKKAKDFSKELGITEK